MTFHHRRVITKDSRVKPARAHCRKQNRSVCVKQLKVQDIKEPPYNLYRKRPEAIRQTVAKWKASRI